MSNLTFPSLPIIEGDRVRAGFYDTTVHTTESGREVRQSWASMPRYRFQITFTVRDFEPAPDGWGVYSEREVIEHFFDVHRGRWDSFLFQDDKDGVTRRVRFDTDELEFRDVGGGVYEVDVELVSVL